MMILFSEENVKIDEEENSLELFYIYIISFKIFKNQGFCLNPAYYVSKAEYEQNVEELHISIEKKKNFVDLFKEYNVNVMILCGRNGCGKTTLLKLLDENQQESEKINGHIIYVYKDKDNHFYASKKTVICRENRENVVCSNKGIFKRKHENNNVNLRRDIVELSERLLLDIKHGEKKNSFSHFYIRTLNIEKTIDELKSMNMEGLFKDIDFNKVKNDFILYYFIIFVKNCGILNKSFNETFCKKDVKRVIEYLENECDKDKLFIEIKSLEKVMKSPYRIQDVKKANADIINFCLKCDELFSKIFSFSSTVEGFEIFYYEGFSEENGEEVYLKDFSSGEKRKAIYRYDIYKKFTSFTSPLLCVDEPENSLHPEWCRKFISDYLTIFKGMYAHFKQSIVLRFIRYEGRILLVFSTHSPFLLSDVTNDYIIYLERQSDGSVKQIFKDKNTFAGNIGELFSENFFMDNTIGEFARSKIQKMIARLKSEENISKEEMSDFKHLIDCVGDDLLKELLLDLWERKNEKNKTDR